MLEILLAVAILLGVVGVGLLICALSYRVGYVHGYLVGVKDLVDAVQEMIED